MTNFPTNFPDWAAISTLAVVSNELSNISWTLDSNGAAANAQLASNSAFATWAAASNSAAVAGNEAAVAFSNLTGGSFGADTNLGAGGSDGYVLLLGQDLSGVPLVMNLSYESLPSGVKFTISTATAVLSWVIAVSTFMVMLHDTREAMHWMFHTGQVRGPTQMILGTNASGPIGLVYATVFSALLGAIPVIGVAVFATMHTQTSTGGANLNTMASGMPAWTMASAMFPVGNLLVAFATWASYKYLLLTPYVILACTIVKSMVA